MAAVLAVQFTNYGTWHYLRPPAGVQAHVGDEVLYPTTSGYIIATVAWVGEAELPDEVPTSPGLANNDYRFADAKDRARRAEIECVAKSLISSKGLNMKVLAVDIEYPADGPEQSVIYYESLQRVDFRALVGQLARALDSRIDLRQVSSRDAACLVRGAGACGRQTCCTSWIGELQPVSCPEIRNGRIPGTANSAYGVCGRLKCCLRFAKSAGCGGDGAS